GPDQEARCTAPVSRDWITTREHQILAGGFNRLCVEEPFIRPIRKEHSGSMLLNRRQLLKLGLLSGSGLLLPNEALAQSLRSPPVEPFTRPLAIPPILTPVSSDESQDYYEVAMEQAQLEIIPGALTTIWGYNGLYPGPT